MAAKTPANPNENSELQPISKKFSEIESVLEGLFSMDDRKTVRIICATRGISVHELARLIDLHPNTLYKSASENRMSVTQRFFLHALLTDTVDKVMGG